MPDDTRDRLVEAAAAVFSEKGYEGAGVQEIARRAGLTTGAIYSRFSGKAELLREVVESRTVDELDLLFSQHDFVGHASDVIKEAGAYLVGRRPDEPQIVGDSLLLEALVAARRDPDIKVAVKAMVEDRATRLADIIEAAKTDGSIDASIDTDSAVRFCHAVGLGFLIFEAIGVDLPQPKPWEDLITRLVSSLTPATDSTQPDTKGD